MYKHMLFFRNNVNVEGATHKQVVDLIRSGGDTLTLTGMHNTVFALFILIVVSVVAYKNLSFFVSGFK